MPAQSPTLSPTLSAITPGLRGSSSGMPASTLPTRSAPTSAPLVKMPPPSRAKIEISEPPKARPMSACSVRPGHAHRDQNPVIAGDADEAEADDQHAGDRAAAKCDVERFAHAFVRSLRGAHIGPNGDVHADVAGGTREHGADQKTDRGRPAEGEAEDQKQHDADGADRQCTGGSDRRWRLPESRRRSPASARYRQDCARIHLVENAP